MMKKKVAVIVTTGIMSGDSGGSNGCSCDATLVTVEMLGAVADIMVTDSEYGGGSDSDDTGGSGDDGGDGGVDGTSHDAGDGGD